MESRATRSWPLVWCAVLVGLVWCAVASWMVGFLSLEDFRGSGGIPLAISCVVAALLPAWVFRRFLADLPLSATFPAALLGLGISALCLTATDFALIYLCGESIEEVEEAVTLVGKLGMSVGLALFCTIGAFIAALQTFYVSLPLAWFSLLLLRWASRTPSPALSLPRMNGRTGRRAGH